MTQVCPPNKPLRLSPMSQLDLKCGSLCEMSGTKYEWVKTRGAGKEGVVRMESDESSMAIKSVYYGDGGTYKCSCLPDGPQCEQTVYSKNEKIFCVCVNHVCVHVHDGMEAFCTCCVTVSVSE